MKQPIMLEPSLKEFHWDELANVHFDLCFCRQRFIRAVNEKVVSNAPSSIEDLDQLAKVDELLQAAAERLEAAKAILFDRCYDAERVES